MTAPKLTIDIDRVDLSVLLAQIAATVLSICETRQPGLDGSPQSNVQGYDPIGIKLSQYVNWADHGYTNALQKMVEQLYNAVQKHLEDQTHLFLLDSGEFRIITDALAAYQAWKEKLIAAEKDRYGSTYGDGSGFNTRDWSDLNQRFLSAVGLKQTGQTPKGR